MKLEVGKSYRTRDGSTVKITDFDSDDPCYPFVGTDPYGVNDWWTKDGKYFDHSDHRWDLVAPQSDISTDIEASLGEIATALNRIADLLESVSLRDRDFISVVPNRDCTKENSDDR